VPTRPLFDELHQHRIDFGTIFLENGKLKRTLLELKWQPGDGADNIDTVASGATGQLRMQNAKAHAIAPPNSI